jgi:hypothetical protein
MSDDLETIPIAKCPICGASHTYSLKVERSFYWAFLRTSITIKRQQSIRFTRFFTCPVKLMDFQWRFVLKQSPLSQIKSVEVVGLVQKSSKRKYQASKRCFKP